MRASCKITLVIFCISCLKCCSGKTRDLRLMVMRENYGIRNLDVPFRRYLFNRYRSFFHSDMITSYSSIQMKQSQIYSADEIYETLIYEVLHRVKIYCFWISALYFSSQATCNQSILSTWTNISISHVWTILDTGFFLVLACHLLVLDGFEQHFQATD